MIEIFIGKIIFFITQIFHLGAGGTWPGEISLRINPDIMTNLLESLDKGVIIIAGTNGKTTTSLMVKQILEKNGNTVIHNTSGANLTNGIVSAFIQHAKWTGKIKADWGVFETDENSLPRILSDIKNQKSKIKNKKLVIVLLNLFRDQLDRYGEVDVIAEKWHRALKNLPGDSTLILNSDDPGIAWLGKTLSYSRPDRESVKKDSRFRGNDKRSGNDKTQENNIDIKYFGINNPELFLKQKEHATDSAYCLNCGSRLNYSGIYYSHIGIWHCPNCGNSRPRPDINSYKQILPGLYNQYNTLAAISVAKNLKIAAQVVDSSLNNFQPAFGRQEEFDIDRRKIKIFLSKNPAGFNASLRTVMELKPKTILVALNDRIPDGRDISWIWDVDFEMIPDSIKVICAGDRALDLGLRIKYAFQNKISNIKNKPFDFAQGKNDNTNLKIINNLSNAIIEGLKEIENRETLYILPTYSAMLDIRKIISGKKIL